MIERLRRFNWILLLAMLALVALGATAIWSAGAARSEAVFHVTWLATLRTALAGFALYLVLAFGDYRKYLPLAATPLYALSLVLLAAVLAFGSTVYGGRRWLWFFQPSELAKLGVLAFLAVALAWLKRRVGAGFPTFLCACAIAGVPILLILLEPDLGTALTLVPAVLAMLLAARVWRKGLLTLLALGALGAAALLGAVYEAERPGTDDARRARILRYVPLRPHQVRRVKVFLFPSEDPLGAGYNLRQAMISIGSGGLTGKGLGKGETNHLKYLPPAISMNDFIFCVWAEETGFVGTSVLLALFALVTIPGAWVAYRSSDGTGALLALGVSTLVFAHVWINIAMSVGLVPITGLPLPFISAGRTFLVTVMAGLGLIQSVSIYGKETQ